MIKSSLADISDVDSVNNSEVQSAKTAHLSVGNNSNLKFYLKYLI